MLTAASIVVRPQHRLLFTQPLELTEEDVKLRQCAQTIGAGDQMWCECEIVFAEDSCPALELSVRCMSAVHY